MTSRNELLERREEIARELANAYLDQLEEAYQVSFDREERERFALGAIYTISEEELDDTEEDFRASYQEWIASNGMSVMEAKWTE